MKKRNKKNSRESISASDSVNNGMAGFSLIEIVVSLGIFTLIIGGIVLFSVRTIESHTRSRAMQNSIENARFAIENLSKKVRTSNSVTGGMNGSQINFEDTKQLFVVDNIDHTKYCYRFDGGRLEVRSAIYPSDAANLDDYKAIENCGHLGSSPYAGVTGAVTSFQEVVGTDKVAVTGNFYVKSTDLDDATPSRGLVVISLNLAYEGLSGGTNPADQDSVTIQSTVSLRDYPVPGTELQ